MAEDVEVWADKLQHMEVTEIHDEMVNAGIKARPCSARRCALSDFLYEKTGERFSISLSSSMDEDSGKLDTVATAIRHPGEGLYEHLDLGTNAGRFASRFDKGQFPEIEEYPIR